MPWNVTYQGNLGDTLAEATLDLRRGASAYYVLRLALHRMQVPGPQRMSRWQLVRVGWGDTYEWRYSGSERLITAEYTDDDAA